MTHQPIYFIGVGCLFEGIEQKRWLSVDKIIFKINRSDLSSRSNWTKVGLGE